jgi:hypothetical protein
MAMPHRQSVATDEAHNLIASQKVESTAVYKRQGEKGAVGWSRVFVEFRSSSCSR